MAQREKGGRVVFIGNIPYGVSEEEIMHEFSSCGQVLGFRLVYDKETGQPKGFGFLEYSDTDSAETAVRNMNNKQFHGRTLRVDYSNDNRGTTGGTQNQNQNQETNRAPPPAHFNMNAAPPAGARPDPSALPPLPAGATLPPGVSAMDAISSTLAKIETPVLLDFISQLKQLCASNPAQATALLQQQPQLGYAVFQAMLLLGLVDTNIVTQLVNTTGGPPPQVAQPPPQQAPPVHPPQPVGYPPQPPHGYPPPMPQGYPPPMPQGYPPGYAPTPPQQQQPYQPPQQQQAPPQPQPQQPTQADDAQADLVRQVLALSREQIYQMPEGARNQILALRAQYGVPT